ncbi:hypothetical protein SNF32_11415 [Enterococcus mundtii]|uniref:hypothetical protein n=1 Tax=Enterococcus TaxID=1350 RepID=UPI00117735D1|nr:MULTISPECIES: hypothetical protein [Enterococcus]MDY4307657.1 hypothetical protein [Enterococcus mundtii]
MKPRFPAYSYDRISQEYFPVGLLQLIHSSPPYPVASQEVRQMIHLIQCLIELLYQWFIVI